MNKILIDKEFLNKQKCEPSKEFGFIPCSFRGFDGLELIIAGDVPKNFALGIVNCKNVIIKTFSYEKSIIECISMNDSYNIEVQNVCFNELNLEKGKNIIFNNCDFIQVQNEREETHRKNNDPFSWFLRITNCEALFLHCHISLMYGLCVEKFGTSVTFRYCDIDRGSFFALFDYAECLIERCDISKTIVPKIFFKPFYHVRDGKGKIELRDCILHGDDGWFESPYIKFVGQKFNDPKDEWSPTYFWKDEHLYEYYKNKLDATKSYWDDHLHSL